MITVIGPREPKGRYKDVINTTSRGGMWSQLSPFLLGPVRLYGNFIAQNMENAWQFSKVYPEHVDKNGNPSQKWLKWARQGWDDKKAHRYPMGKGRKPLYSIWNGRKLDYIEARILIYAPLYAKLVMKTDAYSLLDMWYLAGKDLTLWDFDGYDHRRFGMSYEDVLFCETKKMGHAFVLAMCLQKNLLWEKDDILDKYEQQKKTPSKDSE